MSAHPEQQREPFLAIMDRIWDKVHIYNPQADKTRLYKAFEFARDAHDGQMRKSGEPFFIHALTVADILADLRMDVDTLIAAMVHDVVEDTDFEIEDIISRFGEEVANMVNGVTKISGLKEVNKEARKAETYRKLVLAIANDPRTVLIKLADRLHNMRTIEFLKPDRRQAIAQETMDVYVPFANRFGIARIKWELEDLAFKVLFPNQYDEIEKGINQTRAERERLIARLLIPLQEILDRAGIKGEITGRPKHFYSIYRKMLAQKIGLDRIYDLLALRIIVETKADCYHALGELHALFPPLRDRIKDFIATPKCNMYQSLHSTVRTPQGKYIEVQIRTREMHERAELGIAAHWAYKEGGVRDAAGLGEMVKMLRQIMAWQEDVADPREYMDTLMSDFLRDEVFVNGRIVSLKAELNNGDTVEILTAKTPNPSPGWLDIVKTSRAKHHIRRWVKASKFTESVKLGREILERELNRAHLRVSIDNDLDDVAQAMGYPDTPKLLQGIGSGHLNALKVVGRLTPREESAAEKVLSKGKDLYASLLRRSSTGVRVAGVDNLMVSYARCCQPIPGDSIVGVITRGRGVSVHRVGCSNLNDPNLGPERRIEVSWDVAPDQTFLVKLTITAEDRKNLLMDLSNVLHLTNTNIQSGSFGAEDDVATVTLVVEVTNLNKLEKIQTALRKVRGVQSIQRYQLN
ncbi:(p)ppGpp synthetase [bacterium DOLJORAL78_65_58]|nr:MAG: (p)ppGpp synthetase [bacterium DOLJORAL78_65_58]